MTWLFSVNLVFIIIIIDNESQSKTEKETKTTTCSLCGISVGMSTTGIPSQLWLGLQNNVSCLTKFAKRLNRNNNNHIFISKINFNSNCVGLPWPQFLVFSLSRSILFEKHVLLPLNSENRLIAKQIFVYEIDAHIQRTQNGIHLATIGSSDYFLLKYTWYTILKEEKKPIEKNETFEIIFFLLVRQFVGQYLVSLRIKGFERGGKKSVKLMMILFNLYRYFHMNATVASVD